MQNFLQINKFFVSVVTLCDIFILDLNEFLALMFFYKIEFSLKNTLRAFFFAVFYVLLFAKNMLRIPRKKYGISHFQLF